ncbi:MAG: alpha/beta fold hydrolase [Pseudomonadota bacterium]
MSTASPHLSPPGRLGLIGESRTALDLLTMLAPLAAAQLRPRQPRQRTVVAVPGFGADDRFLAPLRHYLHRHGYDAIGWGLGRNLAGVDMRHALEDISNAWPIEPREPYRGEGGVPYLCERFIETLREQHATHGRPLTLVGWSLGGYIAREAARDLPQIVEQVITLGAPTVGGPKYTMAASFFTRRGMDLDWIEAVVERRERQPIQQPITAIYSRSDGIVQWQASLDGHSPNVRHVQIASAHLGLIFNPRVWAEVLAALAQHNSCAAKIEVTA